MTSIELPLLATVFAVVAGLIHVYIFVLESFRWTETSTRKTFGVKTEQEAETTKFMAYNQGFYNLFLALGAFIGVAFVLLGEGFEDGIGVGMMLLSTASMLCAALVLVAADRRMVRAAAIQGLPPLLTLVGLAFLL